MNIIIKKLEDFLFKNEKIKINEIKKDFGFIRSNKKTLAILLYGSYAKGRQNIKSDIDICIVVPGLKNPHDFSEFLRYVWRNVDGSKYDIRLFEELPLYIKNSVINDFEVIWSKDKSKLHEYFYFFKKLWNDQAVNWLEKKHLVHT